MIVSIMQPCYLPWLGWVERALMSDVLIVLDHVRIDRKSPTQFTNRNRIRTPKGWMWLTVPLKTSGRFDDLAIDGLEVADQPWRRKHWAAISANYGGAAFFARHAPALQALYGWDGTLLAEFLELGRRFFFEAFQVDTRVMFSSQMSVASTKADLVVDLCHAAGATRYISGPFGRDYLDRAAFGRAGIELRFHDYRHPTYAQRFPGFEPYMSALDLLLTHGGEDGRRILHTGETSPA